MISSSRLHLAALFFVAAVATGWMWSRPPSWRESLARTDGALDALALDPSAEPLRTAVLADLSELERLAAAAGQGEPRQAAVLARQGLYYVHVGKLEVARATLATALDLDPNEGRAHEAEVLILLSDGQIQQASKHLAKAVPTLSMDVARGRVMLTGGDLEGARRQLAIVRARAPGFAPLVLLEALIELRVGHRDRARTLFESLARRSDRPAGTLGQIARAYQETGLSRIAASFLARAVREGIDLPREGVLLGDFYLSEGQYAQARTVFESVTERSGEQPAILAKLAFAEAATGSSDRAEDHAQRAEALLKELEEAGQIQGAKRSMIAGSIALAKARAAQARGDDDAAIQIYRLLATSGSMPMVSELLSDVEEKKGQYASALRHYKSYARTQMDNAAMYARLAELAEHAGNAAEAAGYRVHALTLKGGGEATGIDPLSRPPESISIISTSPTRVSTTGPAHTPELSVRSPAYRNATAEAGIVFEHRLVPPLIYTPQVNPPGVAMADLDNDGYADLVLLQSGNLAGNEAPTVIPMRNLGNGRFADVTGQSGIRLSAFAGGVTACDIDSDGYIDLAIGTLDGLYLLRNCGDGTFRPWPGAYPLVRGWVSAVAMADVNGDGRLDLYATRYARLERSLLGRHPSMINNFKGRYRFPITVAPAYFPTATGALMMGRPDGSFQDVTAQMGVANTGSWGMTVIMADLTGSGWPDIYIANDASLNRFYLNDRGRTFEDVSHKSWTDDPRGSMGLALDDLTGDGTPDLVVTNWIDQENGLFMREHGIIFDDRAIERGVTKPDMDLVSWGCVFTDTLNSGKCDLVIANGGTFAAHYDPDALESSAEPFIPQPFLYYENTGPGTFRLRDESVFGPLPRSSCRGLAAGDIDNDGGEDLIAGVNGGTPILLRNVAPARGHWLEVELVGVHSPRQGTGARVRVTTQARAHTRWALAGDSYQSCSSAILHFGIGRFPSADVRIDWPSGRTQVLTAVRVDQRLRVVEPDGQ